MWWNPRCYTRAFILKDAFELTGSWKEASTLRGKLVRSSMLWVTWKSRLLVFVMEKHKFDIFIIRSGIVTENIISPESTACLEKLIQDKMTNQKEYSGNTCASLSHHLLPHAEGASWGSLQLCWTHNTFAMTALTIFTLQITLFFFLCVDLGPKWQQPCPRFLTRPQHGAEINTNSGGAQRKKLCK